MDSASIEPEPVRIAANVLKIVISKFTIRLCIICPVPWSLSFSDDVLMSNVDFIGTKLIQFGEFLYKQNIYFGGEKDTKRESVWNILLYSAHIWADQLSLGIRYPKSQGAEHQ